MDKQCSTCKYWGVYNDGDSYDSDEARYYAGSRPCGKIPRFSTAVVWTKGSDREVVADKSVKAFANDGSDYIAFVTTMPDFYCNMWEG